MRTWAGSLFYGTIPKVTLARRYLASCPAELGLSSNLTTRNRLSYLFYPSLSYLLLVSKLKGLRRRNLLAPQRQGPIGPNRFLLQDPSTCP